MALIVKKQSKIATKRNNATSDKMKALLFEYFRFSPKQLHCVSEVIYEYVL